MEESGESIFSKFKNKITFENKRIFGAILIIVGIIFIILGFDNILCLIFAIIPGIVFCIPNEQLKNSKILGIIFIILMVILLINVYSQYCYLNELWLNSNVGFWTMAYDVSYSVTIDYYYPLLCDAILYIYGLFVSLLYFIETKENKIINQINYSNDVKTSNNFCKYCGERLNDENSSFCPNCGKKL